MTAILSSKMHDGAIKCDEGHLVFDGHAEQVGVGDPIVANSRLENGRESVCQPAEIDW